MNKDSMTAEQHRAAASECHAKAEESFDRCDTDGFLSQWAANLTGRLHSAQADILEAGGVSEFWGLYSSDGATRVRAKLIKGKFGQCWAFCDASDKFIGKFLPFCNAAGGLNHELSQECPTFAGWSYDLNRTFTAEESEAAQADWHVTQSKRIAKLTKSVERWVAKHGFRQLREMAPAKAEIVGRGRGLSGSAWVAVVRTDGGYPPGAVAVK